MNLRGPDSFLFVGNLWANKINYNLPKYVVMTRTGQSKVLHGTPPHFWLNARGTADQEMTLVIPRYDFTNIV